MEGGNQYTNIFWQEDQQQLLHLAKALQLPSNNCRLALQLIPGNEQADTLEKQCAQTEQPGSNVSYQENAIITKALIKHI